MVLCVWDTWEVTFWAPIDLLDGSDGAMFTHTVVKRLCGRDRVHASCQKKTQWFREGGGQLLILPIYVWTSPFLS